MVPMDVPALRHQHEHRHDSPLVEVQCVSVHRLPRVFPGLPCCILDSDVPEETAKEGFLW